MFFTPLSSILFPGQIEPTTFSVAVPLKARVGHFTLCSSSKPNLASSFKALPHSTKTVHSQAQSDKVVKTGMPLVPKSASRQAKAFSSMSWSNGYLTLYCSATATTGGPDCSSSAVYLWDFAGCKHEDLLTSSLLGTRDTDSTVLGSLHWSCFGGFTLIPKAIASPRYSNRLKYAARVIGRQWNLSTPTSTIREMQLNHIRNVGQQEKLVLARELASK